MAGSVFQAVSECIFRIRVKTHYSFATIIAVYAPTNLVNATAEARASSDVFYDQLQATLAAVPSRDLLIVLGDFNACTGANAVQWRSVIGLHGPKECNKNGERLLDFCACNNLVITNTWFQHKPIHQLTWYRNGDRTNHGHLLDYVLVNHSFRSSVLDTRIYRATYLESDHELVISMLCFKIKTKRCQARQIPRRQTRSLSAM